MNPTPRTGCGIRESGLNPLVSGRILDSRAIDALSHPEESAHCGRDVVDRVVDAAEVLDLLEFEEEPLFDIEEVDIERILLPDLIHACEEEAADPCVLSDIPQAQGLSDATLGPTLGQSGEYSVGLLDIHARQRLERVEEALLEAASLLGVECARRDGDDSDRFVLIGGIALCFGLFDSKRHAIPLFFDLGDAEGHPFVILSGCIRAREEREGAKKGRERSAENRADAHQSHLIEGEGSERREDTSFISIRLSPA